TSGSNGRRSTKKSSETADPDAADAKPAKRAAKKTTSKRSSRKAETTTPKDDKGGDTEGSIAVDEPIELSDNDDFDWDDDESEALRQARKDAELTASADSVRAYLKQIGKVPLLNAEQEVELAKRIEAGLYAAERL